MQPAGVAVSDSEAVAEVGGMLFWLWTGDEGRGWLGGV